MIENSLDMLQVAHAFRLQGFADRYEHSRSPFPAMEVPPMHESQHGPWTLARTKLPRTVRGYFSGPLRFANDERDIWVLKRQCPDTPAPVIWMSNAPMEMESQAHHAMVARGDVLIGGWGMGVLAYNVARKREVYTVTVVELDSDVRMLARALMKEWPDEVRQKVTLIDDNMLTYRSSARYDFALIDIWPLVGDSALREDCRTIYRNVPGIEQMAAWGMELDFISFQAALGEVPFGVLGAEEWEQYAAGVGFPVFMNRRFVDRQMMAEASRVAMVQSVLQWEEDLHRRAAAKLAAQAA